MQIGFNVERWIESHWAQMCPINKETFTNIEAVRSFIKEFIPKEVSGNIDLRTLKLDNNTYIDENFDDFHSDLVYNCTYKGKSKLRISLLFEHKSNKSKYPHIQLLKYLMKIWETDIKQNLDLHPVIPIVIFHGNQEWKYIYIGVARQFYE